ncbi:MAG: hypothetical protein H0W89_04990 [Candidatus Levybacteria bacterium]|nr:hypothetical protein [Candidatus Levybacteria bacterium]
MKQQSAANQPVTEKILKETLKDYPTKDELSTRLDKSFEAFRQENAYQFKLMREEIYEAMATFTNRVLTAIDPLLKNLEFRQQEREIAAAQMKNVTGDITDLQKRVTKLEHS